MVTAISLIFFVTAICGTPIAFAAGIAGAAYIVLWEGLPPDVMTRIIYYHLDSFPLLAIPLFIMLGAFAEKAGMLDGLVRWLLLIVGRMRAGMAYVNVLASMFFAGVNGAANADVASLGPLEMKLMRRCGYDDRFSASLVAASAIAGPIIPPSIGMVVYALAGGNISIGGLFLAGAVPGVLLCGTLLVLSYFLTRKGDLILGRDKMAAPEWMRAFWKECTGIIHILILPFFIVGSIVSGMATVTEAAAVGAVYTLLVGMFIMRTLRWQQIFDSVVWAALMSAVVGMLIGGGALIGWILTRNRATAQLAEYLISISSEPLFYLIAVSVALFIVGMFIDVLVAIIALAPLLAPVADTYGISSLHFGLVFILSIEIGLITPPIGNLLFMTSVISGVRIEHLCISILPFVFFESLVVVVAILWPPLTLWLPGLFGFQ